MDYGRTMNSNESQLCAASGVISGAIPPIMGWTSVTGAIDLFAYCLFGVLLIWQLPHFWAISIYHAKDYECADIKVYPNHYKAMNPNLAKFNNIDNPFYLWAKGKKL